MEPILTLAELTSIVAWVAVIAGCWFVASGIRQRRSDEGRANLFLGMGTCLVQAPILLGDAISDAIGMGLIAFALISLAASVVVRRRHSRAQRKPA